MRSAGALPSQREKKLKEQNSSRCPVALLMNSLKEARCPLAGPPANLFGWRDACGLQLASMGGGAKGTRGGGGGGGGPAFPRARSQSEGWRLRMETQSISSQAILHTLCTLRGPVRQSVG